MPKFERDTVVTFPSGAVVGDGNVLWSGELPLKGTNLFGIITDTSPFHPIDHNWPDQPGDAGWATINGRRYRLNSTLTAAVEKGGDRIFLDTEIHTKRGDPNWVFLVFHVLDHRLDETGDLVTLEVDKDERRDISVAHTACHLSSLALNKVCKAFWQKEVRTDSLGNPNFDALFIQQSKIGRLTTEDHYRIGKSARKSGLDAGSLLDQLPVIEGRINRQLAEWIKSNERVSVTPGEAPLSSKRVWECRLIDGLAAIPCGGSHARRLNDFFEIRVNLQRASDVPEFTLRAKVLLA